MNSIYMIMIQYSLQLSNKIDASEILLHLYIYAPERVLRMKHELDPKQHDIQKQLTNTALFMN